jgi:RHS repeat-associated protein
MTNLAYVFNNKGNLEYRQDNIAGYKETAVYDDKNRLTNWNVSRNGATLQNNSLVFDPATGNIQAKSDLGNLTMNYGANGKPHALTSVSGVPDLMSSNQTIEYTDFKKVKKITDSGNILNISYGVDEQRIKTVLTKNNTSLTRYYLGDYEEEITGNSGDIRKIHYIYGGNGLAAVYVQHSSQVSDTLYYAHTDYQGSLTALSLPDGTVAQRYAYDPWGNRRNPENWTQRDTRTAFILNRGYTMHEHLDEFGLINMNGRVYDPLTAQFFSPDPYLQAPGDWLNYNRYGYCLNNPFKYDDPSGEWVHIVIGAVVGGVINVAVHWNTINSFGDGLVAFGIGAAGGALAAATGGAALASYGTAAGAGGFIGGAAAAGVAYTSGTLATSIGNAAYFGDPMPTPEQFATGLGFAMVTGGLINGTLAITRPDPGNFWSGNSVAQGRGVFSFNNTPIKQTPAPSIPKIQGPEIPMPELQAPQSPGLKPMPNNASLTEVPLDPENLGTLTLPKEGQIRVHGNSLQSQRPTWGYKLYDNDGTFLKNGITSKPIPEMRYTRTFMETHKMVPIQQFPNRMGAWQWEYQQNLIQRGPWNLNMH